MDPWRFQLELHVDSDPVLLLGLLDAVSRLSFICVARIRRDFVTFPNRVSVYVPNRVSLYVPNRVSLYVPNRVSLYVELGRHTPTGLGSRRSLFLLKVSTRTPMFSV
jgi:hypothetical protein